MKQINKSKSLIVLFAVVTVLFISCATNPNLYAPIDDGVDAGDYEYALSVLNNEKGKARQKIYTPKNEILLYLDRGMINHYAGEYSDSSADLQEAERLIEEAYTKSISQSAASYIANDNSMDYPGEDYEDIYINVFNSLNYYHAGNLESALVEIRRLNEKLSFFADKYERAQGKVAESDTGQADLGDLSMEASSFSNSALARYLGVLFHRGTGNEDGARIDHEELLRAYGLAPAVYTNHMPSSVQEELSTPEGMVRLNVIAFTGLSPLKEEETITIPLPFEFPNNTAKIALPVMIDRPAVVDRVEVILNNGSTIHLELLEDMGAVARETFKSKYVLTVMKSTIRSIVKVTASAVATKVASEQNAAVGLLVGITGRVAAGASERADIRLSRYFPRYALVGGIDLEPGTYSATINYYEAGRYLLHSETKDITVRANGVNLIESIYLK